MYCTCYLRVLWEVDQKIPICFRFRWFAKHVFFFFLYHQKSQRVSAIIECVCVCECARSSSHRVHEETEEKKNWKWRRPLRRFQVRSSVDYYMISDFIYRQDYTILKVNAFEFGSARIIILFFFYECVSVVIGHRSKQAVTVTAHRNRDIARLCVCVRESRRWSAILTVVVVASDVNINWLSPSRCRMTAEWLSNDSLLFRRMVCKIFPYLFLVISDGILFCLFGMNNN